MNINEKYLGHNKPQTFSVTKLAIVKEKQEFNKYNFLEFKDHFVGIEVEVENVVGPPSVPFWEIKPDGSLRNNGVEFVSVPITTSWVPYALNLLFKKLPAAHRFSQRTSIHVHVDYSTCTEEDVYRAVLLYCIFERALFRFVGMDRDSNIFCPPLMDSELYLRFKAPKDLPSMGKIWNKYSALNLLRLFDFGTIEYRQMHGTNDIAKLLSWIKILELLKIAALQLKTTDIRTIFLKEYTEEDIQKLYTQVFGKFSHLLDRNFLYEDCKTSVFLLKDMYAPKVHHSAMFQLPDKELFSLPFYKKTPLQRVVTIKEPPRMRPEDRPQARPVPPRNVNQAMQEMQQAGQAVWENNYFAAPGAVRVQVGQINEDQ